MKRVKNKIVYDTTKSELISTSNQILSVDENPIFNLQIEIYKTPNNRWFYINNGFGDPCVEEYFPELNFAQIIPFENDDDVVRFLENNQEVEILEKYFPDKIEQA